MLALDSEEIDLEQLKWVVLMVLFYQPGREVAYAWMEDLVFEDMEAVIHWRSFQASQQGPFLRALLFVNGYYFGEAIYGKKTGHRWIASQSQDH